MHLRLIGLCIDKAFPVDRHADAWALIKLFAVKCC
jgi:hypothetical protein